ncbi:YjhG/YagF family D-xylonate dehydratase [Salibacterium sp. K-3]
MYDSLEKFMMPGRENIYEVKTKAKGPEGALPLNAEMLKHSPSGNLFGLSQNVGMGWEPGKLNGKQVLLLSTQGGIRNEDGTPTALGYHTGHWEVGLLMEEAANEISHYGGIPFAGYVSDPCDGRSQGTTGMFDSFPYRNDAAVVYRRLIRSLPTRKAVIGVATCDKGLPAMMIALASMHDLPTVIVPGGVTLPPDRGEDAGKVQTIGARFSNDELSLQEAAELGCAACATPGGGCQFLGTAATSQVVGEAMGFSVPHSALAPSGQDIWREMAAQSARAAMKMEQDQVTTKDILTDSSIHNAMVMHAAFGGSTNLLLHIPAIAHAAGLKVPDVKDWNRINRAVPRLVSVLPNGPVHHPTVQVYLAGGLPEVMLRIRHLNLLDENARTVTGYTIGEMLDWWETSDRRRLLKQQLWEKDGIDADDIIMTPELAEERGLTSTVTFPSGNLAPEGAVIKSTSIDPSVLDEKGIYHKRGKVKVYTSEPSAIAAIKEGSIVKGDIMIVAGSGPMGTGMEETYQLTSALKHLSYGKHVTLLTDARFSGVSTGACFGHIGPEGLAGGPIGKLRDGDVVDIYVDTRKLEGHLHFVGTEDHELSVEQGEAELKQRTAHPGLKPHDDLPDDTRLWAALQEVSGGIWGGSVYDTDRIVEVLEAGKKALASN